MNRLPFWWGERAHTVQQDTGRFRADSGHQVMTVLVETPNAITAIRSIIGSSKKAGGHSSGLLRYLPARHKRYPHLRATEILSVKGVRPSSQEIDGLGYTGQYELTELQILFEAPNYVMSFDGAQAPAEYQRFVFKESKPTLETLTRRDGNQSFQFPNASTVAFSGNTTARVPKLQLIWHWYNVPEDYLYGGVPGQPGAVPSNLLSAVGCVNDAAFPANVAGDPLSVKYATGTLLMLEPVLKPKNALYYNLDPTASPDICVLTYDVDVIMIWFDPNPTGDTVNGVIHRGHNLFPVGTPIGGKLWYLGTRGGTTTPSLTGNDLLYNHANFETPWRGVP